MMKDFLNELRAATLMCSWDSMRLNYNSDEIIKGKIIHLDRFFFYLRGKVALWIMEHLIYYILIGYYHRLSSQKCDVLQTAAICESGR